MDSIVISDLHLSDADTGRTDKPFWKAYKRKEHFFDDDLVRMIRHVEAEAQGGVELILNGDVFDFDNVVAIPPNPPSKVSWLRAGEVWALKNGCLSLRFVRSWPITNISFGS